MKNLTPFWFTPDHQPKPDAPITFQLRPLDMPTFWALQSNFQKTGFPGWEGVSAAFEYSVLDWNGVPAPFSREEKRRALKAMDKDFAIWLGEIAGTLYRQAVLSEEDAKNS